MFSTPSSIAICVPVRDEAVRLPALIDALVNQVLPDSPVTLCFFFDGCHDASEDVLARYPAPPMRIATARVHPGAKPNAGRARAAAMALGLRETGENGLLLTTDADSVPARDWVVRCTAALEHAEIVTGRIVREQCHDGRRQDRVEVYLDRLHALRRRLDPVPWEAGTTHHFTGGANMAFRAEAYTALGGFAPLASGEDAAIIDEAARAGIRVRRDAATVVTTSSRRNGRAPDGLAAALLHGDAGCGPIVSHPEDAAWQYVRHAQARSSFTTLNDRMVLHRFARVLTLTPDHVIGVARDCPNAEAFAMRIVPAPPGERHVSLDVAERALLALEAPGLSAVA